VDGRNYYHWIEKVWDSAVLPSCVPKEIPGVQVDQTTWKMSGHKTISGNNEVGNMVFADTGFESWGLSFYCTNAQREAFLQALAGNGFFGGQTNDSPLVYEYVGNGYYAYARINDSAGGDKAQGGYNNLVMFSITPAGHKLPKSFNGWPMPQAGAARRTYDDWAVQYFDDKSNDWRDAQWDLRSDKGSMPAKQWTAWFAYFGVGNAEAAAYVKTLEADGWKITWQNQDNEHGYSCQLQKEKTWARVFFDRRYEMQVGFSDVPEALDY
jgi:hypothetical protein